LLRADKNAVNSFLKRKAEQAAPKHEGRPEDNIIQPNSRVIGKETVSLNWPSPGSPKGRGSWGKNRLCKIEAGGKSEGARPRGEGKIKKVSWGKKTKGLSP